ncbi:hypothetical protein N665_0104s0316 [Sinapis alba]|nr:hypothetical protein N665_0104s0316 [Sinapis alba]
MPQVDLEAFVCSGGSDRKITCESTFTDDDDPETRPYNNNNNSAASPTDFPPESYFLSKDAQHEWFTDNAFFDRKESHRGNSSVNIINSNTNSQRYSKASIIGLPKPQDTCLNEAKQRRNVGKADINKTRVFLKRVGSRTKTDISQLEPSSPKVSCMGRVRSKRERSRQKSVRPEKSNRVKKPGFMASFRAIFRIGGGCKHAPSRGTHEDIRSRLPPENVEPVATGLGRFASGRRGDLLGGCVDVS